MMLTSAMPQRHIAAISFLSTRDDRTMRIFHIFLFQERGSLRRCHDAVRQFSRRPPDSGFRLISAAVLTSFYGIEPIRCRAEVHF